MDAALRHRVSADEQGMEGERLAQLLAPNIARDGFIDRAPGTVPQKSGCRLQHRAEIEEGNGDELHIDFLVYRRGKAEKALISRHVGGLERGDLTGERNLVLPILENQ